MFLPPLMLTGEEIEAVVLGLRYVDQRGDEVLARAAADALAKIATVLSPAARDAMNDPMTLPGPPGREFPANAVDLDVLRAAIRSQAKLRIAYADAAGVRSERIVWPVALGFMNEARILVAWCESRQAHRTFRTDRLLTATLMGERYPGRRSVRLREWVAQADARPFAPDKI
jgi:predicted DNA-binding transcriptional regulator YafY